MKKIILVLMMLLFVGCADYKELNDIAIVSGLSIDREKDNYSIGVLIANSKDGDNVLYKSEAKTIAEAIKKLESITPKQLYFGHLGVVILSEDTCKIGLDKISDYFFRNPETTKRFYMVMSKEKAIDVLKIISPLETYPFQSIKLNIEDSSNSSYVTNSLTYSKFIEMLITKGIEPYVPTIKIVKNKSDDEVLVKEYIELDNIALFKGSKFIDYASTNESRGINLLLGNTKDMLITTDCFSAVVSKIKVKKNIKNNNIVFDIKGKADISRLNCDYNVNNINKYNNIINKNVKKIAEEGMNKLYKLNLDTLGLNNYMYKHNKNIKFKDINVSYNIDIKIKNEGSIKGDINEIQ